MSGFIKVLLIFFIVYTLLRLFFRYVFPYLLSRFLNRKMEEMSKRFNNFQYQQNNNSDTEITINNSSNQKKYSKNSGEYVDYEEIKE